MTEQRTSETVVCQRCGGSGFSGRGTGYDDVCSECGGLRELPVPSAQCCANWERAQGYCTDNEGYGPLLTDYDNPRGRPKVNPPEWHIGSSLDAIRFCPWCGAKKL